MEQLISDEERRTHYLWWYTALPIDLWQSILRWCEEYPGFGRYYHIPRTFWLFIECEEDVLMFKLKWDTEFK